MYNRQVYSVTGANDGSDVLVRFRQHLSECLNIETNQTDSICDIPSSVLLCDRPRVYPDVTLQVNNWIRPRIGIDSCDLYSESCFAGKWPGPQFH